MTEGIQIVDGVQLFPDLEAVLVMDSSVDFRVDYDFEPLVYGPYRVAPWGEDNLLPNHLLE